MTAQYEIFDKPTKQAPTRSLADLVHRCRTCGIACGLSDDGGRTWFCAPCRPSGFFPKDRVVAPRKRRAEPAPIAAPDSDEF
jgi:hypothetical protein